MPPASPLKTQGNQNFTFQLSAKKIEATCFRAKKNLVELKLWKLKEFLDELLNGGREEHTNPVHFKRG